MPVCDLIQFAHLDNFRNFDFKAIMVLMKKKKKGQKYCSLIDFPFLPSSYRFFNPPRLLRLEVLFQKPVRGFHQGFQTRKNW